MRESWHSAVFLFVTEVAGKVTDDAIWEESFRVFLARDEAHAKELAWAMANSPAHEYINCDDELVRWLCVDILELQSLGLDELGHGSEVFSIMLPSDPRDDRRWLSRSVRRI